MDNVRVRNLEGSRHDRRRGRCDRQGAGRCHDAPRCSRRRRRRGDVHTRRPVGPPSAMEPQIEGLLDARPGCAFMHLEPRNPCLKLAHPLARRARRPFQPKFSNERGARATLPPGQSARLCGDRGVVSVPPARDDPNHGAEECGAGSGAPLTPHPTASVSRSSRAHWSLATQGALFYDSESRNLQSSDRSEEDHGVARALAMQTQL
eukprot:1303134-Prymnesium_polylepis.1